MTKKSLYQQFVEKFNPFAAMEGKGLGKKPYPWKKTVPKQTSKKTGKMIKNPWVSPKAAIKKTAAAERKRRAAAREAKRGK